MQLGQLAPDFEQDTANGSIRFHAWLADSWGMLFSHVHDFSPVCTTELAELARLRPEWARRGIKPIGLSTDTAAAHHRWESDIELVRGQRFNFPLVADSDGSVARLYGLASVVPGQGWTTRSVLIIDPGKRVRAVLTYPQTVGRNFAEILRIVDALQLADAAGVATPANWQDGDPVLIDEALPDEDARRRFPDGWAATLPYVRLVTQPPLARADHSGALQRPAGHGAAGPMRDRARIASDITRRAWQDGAFRRQLLDDPNAVYQRVTGREAPPGVTLRVMEDDAETVHLVIPAKPANVYALSDDELDAAARGAATGSISPVVTGWSDL